MPEQFLLLHVRSGADIGYHGKPGSPVTSASISAVLVTDLLVS